jgi:hypothetical protein
VASSIWWGSLKKMCRSRPSEVISRYPRQRGASFAGGPRQFRLGVDGLVDFLFGDPPAIGVKALFPPLASAIAKVPTAHHEGQRAFNPSEISFSTSRNALNTRFHLDFAEIYSIMNHISSMAYEYLATHEAGRRPKFGFT